MSRFWGRWSRSVDEMGAIGGALLALCAVPELVATMRRGRCLLSWGFLAMWGTGEVLLLAYTWGDWRLALNYGANAAIVAVLVGYRAT